VEGGAGGFVCAVWLLHVAEAVLQTPQQRPSPGAAARLSLVRLPTRVGFEAVCRGGGKICGQVTKSRVTETDAPILDKRQLPYFPELTLSATSYGTKIWCVCWGGWGWRGGGGGGEITSIYVYILMA
jgi:hypothetical protein